MEHSNYVLSVQCSVHFVFLLDICRNLSLPPSHRCVSLCARPLLNLISIIIWIRDMFSSLNEHTSKLSEHIYTFHSRNSIWQKTKRKFSFKQLHRMFNLNDYASRELDFSLCVGISSAPRLKAQYSRNIQVVCRYYIIRTYIKFIFATIFTTAKYFPQWAIKIDAVLWNVIWFFFRFSLSYQQFFEYFYDWRKYIVQEGKEIRKISLEQYARILTIWACSKLKLIEHKTNIGVAKSNFTCSNKMKGRKFSIENGKHLFFVFVGKFLIFFKSACI